jgi:hypothetical protein
VNRKSISVLMALILVLTGVVPSNAGPTSYGYPNKGIWITPEATSVNPSHLSLVNYENNTSQNCTVIGDYPCTEAALNGDTKNRVVGNVILGVCTEKQTTFCIDSLHVKAKSEAVQATFLGYAGGPQTAASEKYGLPPGFDTSLWEGSGVTNASGTSTYAVEANLALQFGSNNKASFFDLSVNVVPYYEEAGQQYTPRYFSGNRIIGGGFNKCFWYKQGICGVTSDYLEGTQVTLSLRVPESLGGWYRGRISDPTIEIQPLGNQQNLLTVSAEPIEAPYLQVGLTDDDVSPGLILGYQLNSNSVGVIRSTEENAFTAIELLRQYASDKATGMKSLWTFSNLSQTGSGCLASTSKVVGFVSTDALAYNGQAPSFKNGVLSYKLAGVHFRPDSKPIEGRYDLVIRSEAARCLYGFSAAPLSASISVVDSAGETKFSTTSMREKDGWIYFEAAGFGYSSPEVRIKLTQPKPAKKTTITCVNIKKPKLTKKVTAITPKCPAGYKKK